MKNNNEIEIRHLRIDFIRKTKVWIKKNKSSKNSIVRLGIRNLYFLRNILSTIKRIFVEKEFRAIFFMKVFKSKRLQQTTAFTAKDRYPEIFSGCSTYFNGRENIKILSYGCSTGEEVLTLRKYFPNATIVGAEINKNSLKICKNTLVDNKITFINSIPSEIRKYSKFDIVFCMAVLQRTPHEITKQGITSLKKIYPFEKFEKQVVELDEYVKQAGLMVIHFSQYSFIDTVVASKYKVLGEYNQDDYGSVVFDKNSNLIKEPTSINSIFIKS